MAYNLSTQAAKLIENVGSFGSLAVGMVTMANGTATLTVPQFRKLHGVVGIVQGATGVGEDVICTATSGNQATLETVAEGGTTTGSSVVMFIAWGDAIR